MYVTTLAIYFLLLLLHISSISLDAEIQLPSYGRPIAFNRKCYSNTLSIFPVNIMKNALRGVTFGDKRGQKGTKGDIVFAAYDYCS